MTGNAELRELFILCAQAQTTDPCSHREQYKYLFIPNPFSNFIILLGPSKKNLNSE